LWSSTGSLEIRISLIRTQSHCRIDGLAPAKAFGFANLATTENTLLAPPGLPWYRHQTCLQIETENSVSVVNVSKNNKNSSL
jgi:hypothetical protein